MEDDDFFTIEDDGLLISFNERVTEAVIPDYVTGIGEEAFRQCASLKSVIIPASVKKILEGAFQGCTSLEEVTLLGNPEMQDKVFKDCPSF